jgi:ABC-type amino acid transport substrate-binding protein
LSVVARLPSPGFWEFSDTDPTELDEGYEYDIARCLQAQFGLHKLRVRDAGADAILAGKVSGYDVALSQVAIAPKRARAVTLSSPYFEPHEAALMRTADRMSTLAEAKRARWGVQSGSPAVGLLRRIGVTKPRVYTSLSDASAGLESKEVDAFLADTAINFGLAGLSNGRLRIAAQFNEPNGPGLYRAVLPKRSTNLGAINAVFESLRRSGELKRLLYRDLGADPGPVPLIPVPSP